MSKSDLIESAPISNACKSSRFMLFLLGSCKALLSKHSAHAPFPRLPPPDQTIRHRRCLPAPTPLPPCRKILVPNSVSHAHVPRRIKPIPSPPRPHHHHSLLRPRCALRKLLRPIKSTPPLRLADRHPWPHRHQYLHPARYIKPRQTSTVLLPPLLHPARQPFHPHPPHPLVPRQPPAYLHRRISTHLRPPHRPTQHLPNLHPRNPLTHPLNPNLPPPPLHLLPRPPCQTPLLQTRPTHLPQPPPHLPNQTLGETPPQPLHHRLLLHHLHPRLPRAHNPHPHPPNPPPPLLNRPPRLPGPQISSSASPTSHRRSLRLSDLLPRLRLPDVLARAVCGGGRGRYVCVADL